MRSFNRTSFFVKFRVVAAGFLEYATELDGLNPQFDDCPGFCPSTGTERSDFCEGCDVKTERDNFRETCESVLSEMPGSRFGFDKLKQAVVDAMLLDDLPFERQTVTTAKLRRIIEGERQRIRRLRDWNKRTKPDV